MANIKTKKNGSSDRFPGGAVSRYPQAVSAGMTISLRCLFQIVTGCAVFFAILRVSPVVAIVATLVITPAIIRTGLAADKYQTEDLPFGWICRVTVFVQSLGVVVMTVLFSGSVFLLVSLMFGVLGMLFGSAVSRGDFSFDVAIVGTAGGMIWGMAAAILAVGYSAYSSWIPEVPDRR